MFTKCIRTIGMTDVEVRPSPGSALHLGLVFAMQRTAPQGGVRRPDLPPVGLIFVNLNVVRFNGMSNHSLTPTEKPSSRK